MKRIVNVLSIVIIVAALGLLFTVYKTAESAAAEIPVEHVVAFAKFPQDVAIPVDFAVDTDAFEQLSAREQRDQYRDWLLFTVVSEAGLTPEDFNKVLFDLPAVRYTYLDPVGDFEYGLTRSVLIRPGEVVALIPADASDDERSDQIAQVVDSHRKNTGDIPVTLHLFDYTLDPATGSATVTRRPDQAGAEWFTEDTGYYQRSLATVDDLNAFMTQIDDITYARLMSGALVVGGRDLHSDHLNIDSEDVAALWQSQQVIQADIAEFDRYWDEQMRQFNVRYPSYTSPYGRSNSNSIATAMALIRPRATVFPNLGTGSVTTMTRDQALADLQARHAQDWVNRGLVNGSGFSLDPDYDFEGLQVVFILDWEPYLISYVDRGILTSEQLDAAFQGLLDKNIIPLLRITDTLRDSPNETISRDGSALESEIDHSYALQKARYDGELEGTEVGMVLFYTDLLMKLWSQNHADSAPFRAIEDFVPDTLQMLSPVYRAEVIALPSTRQWLGPQHNGFQVGRDNSILFSRSATRLYAASSSPLTPGEEVAPNAASAALLEWWNNHYEEVAAYEPQYQRLNQIMKWSLLVGWLYDAGRASSLEFLEPVPVSHDYWFPDWVLEEPGLKYTNWDAVNFFPRDYLGIPTESMPLIFSTPFELFQGETSWNIRGGVSLADLGLFDDLVPIPLMVDDVLLRSNLRYTSDVFSLSDVLTTLDDVHYTLQLPAPNVASVLADAGADVRLRGTYGDLASTSFERTVATRGGGIEIQTSTNVAEIGRLNISSEGNGFVVGWQSRDLDQAYMLTRQMSASPDPRLILSADPNVASAIRTGEGYLVKLRGSDKWLRIDPELIAEIGVPEGYAARAADIGGERNLLFAWGNSPTAAVDGDGFFVLGSYEDDMLRVANAAPEGSEVNFVIENSSVRGVADPETGEIYFSLKDLPPDFQNDPSLLNRLLPATERAEFRTSLAAGDDVARSIPASRFAAEEPIFNPAAEGFDDLAARIAVGPDAAKAAFRQQLDDGLRAVDDLLANGKFAEALRNLETMTSFYGHTPELDLHIAMAQLESGRLGRAADLLNGITRPVEQPSTLLDEIAGRLSKSTDPESLETLARFGVARDEAARAGIATETWSVGAGAERLELNVRLDALPEGRVVSPDAVPPNARIYVQDNPALNNLDWNAPLEDVLRPMADGELPQVVEMPSGRFNDYDPETIFVGDEAVYHAADSARRRGLSTDDLLDALQNLADLADGGSSDDCENQPTSDPQCEQQYVYIVTMPQ